MSLTNKLLSASIAIKSVIPGSPHPDGKIYIFLNYNDDVVPLAPDWLLDLTLDFRKLQVLLTNRQVIGIRPRGWRHVAAAKANSRLVVQERGPRHAGSPFAGAGLQ